MKKILFTLFVFFKTQLSFSQECNILYEAIEEVIYAEKNYVPNIDVLNDDGLIINAADFLIDYEPLFTYKISFKQKNSTGSSPGNPPNSSRLRLEINGEFVANSLYVGAKDERWYDVVLTFDAPVNLSEIKLTVSPISDEFESEYKNPVLLSNITHRIGIKDLIIHKNGECIKPKSIDGINNSSFLPTLGETFVLSAWVKETHVEQPIAYTSNIEVSFNNGTITSSPILCTPSGNIIEGWQRIEKEFTIPETSTGINIGLKNNMELAATYFDDIRIHKVDGNMKSFVYDPITQRLMAELDENNYATFYEYDKEGGLVRVKKETEKGVHTIQETRSGNSKLSSEN